MHARTCLPHPRLAGLILATVMSGAHAQDSGIGVDLQFGDDLDPHPGELVLQSGDLRH